MASVATKRTPPRVLMLASGGLLGVGPFCCSLIRLLPRWRRRWRIKRLALDGAKISEQTTKLGSTPLKTCDDTGKNGLMLSPHGTGTSAATGRVYHFLTGTGQIAVFEIDAEVPTVKLIQTAGSGGASVKDLPGGPS
jgi:hypothetical protein